MDCLNNALSYVINEPAYGVAVSLCSPLATVHDSLQVYSIVPQQTHTFHLVVTEQWSEELKNFTVETSVERRLSSARLPELVDELRD